MSSSEALLAFTTISLTPLAMPRRAATTASTAPPDIGASIEDLKSLLSSTGTQDVRALVEQHLQHQYDTSDAQRRAFLSAAPTFLSLHSDIEASLSALDSLSSILTTFSSDLGAVSHQISTLKQRSAHLDEELRRKRQEEEPLGRLLDRGLVLDPKVVEKIFDTEPDQSWKGAIKELERSIEATRRPLDQLATAGSSSSGSSSRRRTSSAAPSPSMSRRQSATSSVTRGAATTSNGVDLTTPSLDAGYSSCLAEASSIADSCKLMASSKIRSHLVSPFQLMRASVTTNLQVLQTSVLLPHHQPLYAFLARQMPRVAIDVQRAYVAAARLYFETGYRRYARSMGQVRKRGAGQRGSGGGEGSITDSPSTSSSSFATLGGFLGGGSSTSKPGATTADPYLITSSRLSYASLPDEEDAPPIILGYMGDDSSFSAPPEAVLRSMSLVFFDNACSEYTFLVRYFEALGSVGRGSKARGTRRQKGRPAAGMPRSRSGSTTTAGTGQEWDGDTTLTSTLADSTIDEEDDEVDPSESASVVAGDNEEDDEADDPTLDARPSNLVQLSKSEQSLLQGRGASAELFRKIFEPVVGTWLNFCRAVLHGTSANTKAVASASAPDGSNGSGAGQGAGAGAAAALRAGTSYSPLGLMPLLISLRLIDRLLALAEERGAGAVLTGPLLQFKMEAWPLAQRRFTSEVDAVARLAGTAAAGSSGGGGSGWLSSFGLGGSGAGSGATTVKPLPDETVLLIAGRYAALFAQIAALTAMPLSSAQQHPSRSAAAAADESIDSTTTTTTANGGSGAAGASQEQQDPSSTMLSSSLVRLRGALVDVVVSQGKLAAPSSSTTTTTAAAPAAGAGSRKRRLVEAVVRRVREELEGGGASAGVGAGVDGPTAMLQARARASGRTMREVGWWRQWEGKMLAE